MNKIVCNVRLNLCLKIVCSIEDGEVTRNLVDFVEAQIAVKKSFSSHSGQPYGKPSG